MATSLPVEPKPYVLPDSGSFAELSKAFNEQSPPGFEICQEKVIYILSIFRENHGYAEK